MHDNKVKAVLFDLGETLINFGKLNTTGLFRKGAKLSFDYLKQHNQPVGCFTWYCWRNLALVRIRHWITGITGNDFDAMEMIKKIGKYKGFELTEEQWHHFAWLWYRPLSRMARTEPDIKKTLNDLKERGLKLGILSNTFINASSLEKHLQQLGMLKFFSTRLYSYEFDFRKPDRRIFKIAAERIAIPPKNIMFVGDRIDTDINPAKRAGMKVVLKQAYTNDGKNIPPGASKIARLAQLPPLIDSINANEKKLSDRGPENVKKCS